MTEVYPSDNELLNLQSDAEMGVEYIPTGTAPYYLHFRKLLYRLLLGARREQAAGESQLRRGTRATPASFSCASISDAT